MVYDEDYQSKTHHPNANHRLGDFEERRLDPIDKSIHLVGLPSLNHQARRVRKKGEVGGS